MLPVQQEHLVELLAEVRGLRTLAEAQGRELAALRSSMTGGRVLPAPAGDKLARKVVTAHPERMAERVKPGRPAGFVGLLLQVLGVRL